MSTATGLMLSILPLPMPPLTPDGREADLLALWERVVLPAALGIPRVEWTEPDMDRADAEAAGLLNVEPDYEDWVEQAARLQAALDVTPDIHLTLDGAAATFLPTGSVDLIINLAHLPRYGADRTSRHLPFLPTDNAADGYYRLTAFTEVAGRRMHLVGHDTEADRSALIDALLDLHAYGARRVIVKVTRTKYGIHDIALPDTLTYTQAHRLLANHLDWTLIHLDGRPGAFLVQEHVPMQYEYRTFIVGGRPVTGAGCIEKHTPLDNQDLFDPQVQEWRGRSAVHADPTVVTDLVAFAATASARLQAEDPRLTDYVLDVAMGPAGPLVIECNSLRNSGLYASRPRAVVEALLRAT